MLNLSALHHIRRQKKEGSSANNRWVILGLDVAILQPCENREDRYSVHKINKYKDRGFSWCRPRSRQMRRISKELLTAIEYVAVHTHNMTTFIRKSIAQKAKFHKRR